MSYLFEEHFDDESLESYSFGTLPEARAEILEEHLLICEGCRTRLDTTDQYLNAMARGSLALRRKSAKPGLFSHVSEWFRVPAMAWVPAAAMALCVVLFVSTPMLRHGNPTLAPIGETLTAYRDAPLPVPAHHPFLLHLETKGLELHAPVEMTLVDSTGHTLEQKTASPAEYLNFQTTHPLEPGSYFVRILKPGSSDPDREFALDVR